MKHEGRRDDPPRTAVLVRRYRVDLDEVSRKGGRCRSAAHFEVGHIGMLAVTIAGRLHFEVFRVARSSAVAGKDCLYEFGVEFLPVPAASASLHDLAAELDESRFT